MYIYIYILRFKYHRQPIWFTRSLPCVLDELFQIASSKVLAGNVLRRKNMDKSSIHFNSSNYKHSKKSQFVYGHILDSQVGK